MSQKLFDEEEKVEKKVQVKNIEQGHSYLSRINLPKLSLPVSVPNFGDHRTERKAAVIAVEFLLIAYLALGYAGLVPLF